MANPEKKSIIREVGEIALKALLAVGLLGVIAKFVNLEKIAHLKNLIDSYKKHA